MNEKTWLEEAADVTLNQRQKTYGHPLINLTNIGIAWYQYLRSRPNPDGPITAEDVAWMNNLSKMYREVENHKRDNGVDAIGYISLIDVMDQHMKTLGYDGGITCLRDMTVGDLFDLIEDGRKYEREKAEVKSARSPYEALLEYFEEIATPPPHWADYSIFYNRYDRPLRGFPPYGGYAASGGLGTYPVISGNEELSKAVSDSPQFIVADDLQTDGE